MSSLIKNVFLPEELNNYYIFSKYIVGIEINKTSIIATKSYIKGDHSSIDLIVEEKLEQQDSEVMNDFIAKALTSIMAKMGYYDEIHLALPSSMIIFKELTLPFMTREKINMVIGFEIEPLLPFSLQDAVINFIITKQNNEEKTSDILVTAVQKQQLLDYLAPFQSAGISPSRITVDIISLYGIYKRIPSYNALTGGTALIDFGLYATRIALMIDSQLKIVRTLPKGITFIAKKTAQNLSLAPNEVMESLARFGLNNTEPSSNTQEIEKTIQSLVEDLQFTLTSFTTQFLNRRPITKALFLGDGCLIKGLVPFVTNKLNITGECFNAEALTEDPTLSIKQSVTINPVTITSVSASLLSPLTSDYNLQTQELETQDNSLIVKQLVSLVVLTIMLFTGLISNYTMQTKKLRKEITASEQQALNALKEQFTTLEDEKNLNDAIEAAEIELDTQKSTWFAFSNQSRSSLLQYLLELTSKIDSKSIGLDVEQIIIGEGVLTLKAQVKDHDALKVLERELGQSKLFSYVEPQENPQFTMKILLAPNSEEL